MKNIYIGIFTILLHGFSSHELCASDGKAGFDSSDDELAQIDDRITKEQAIKAIHADEAELGSVNQFLSEPY
ncbi:hypothetical protein KBC04_04975 [Candidatus Babeliales bacterium]|nr:hypothetical protein [Candidatus Babeliales bacterium]MBP9844314.1 hypothetical protein [Candidatus Babeliales bacterium]